MFISKITKQVYQQNHKTSLTVKSKNKFISTSSTDDDKSKANVDKDTLVIGDTYKRVSTGPNVNKEGTNSLH